MAINVYTGLMGSGKSYEVVSSVILAAVQKGRRVVTNIDGINPQAIRDYILSESKLTGDALGEVVSVTTEDVSKPFFFPSEDHPDVETVVRGGDLVAIDECWRFWSGDDKISDEHMTFFRMHRHFTHPETGVTCDIALMIQDLGTLHRKLRAVVEMSTRTVKLKALGFNKNYRIEIYEGNKLTKNSHLDTYNKRYNPKIFPLYKSYAAGDGKETAMDNRQNILLNPKLWFGVVFVTLLGGWGIWGTYRFFNPTFPSSTATKSLSGDLAGKSLSGAGSFSPPSPKPPQVNFSNDWRIAGRYEANGQNWTVLVNTSGKLRVESPSAFSNSGYALIGDVDGQKVTVWSGSSSGGLFQPPTASAPPSPTAPR